MLLRLMFYLIMVIIWLVADGKLGASPKMIKWRESNGIKLKKYVKILTVIYTVSLIVQLIS